LDEAPQLGDSEAALPIRVGAATVETTNNYSRRKNMSDSEATLDEWPTAEEKANNVARAKALRQQAEKMA
jgi:hypothetical protein